MNTDLTQERARLKARLDSLDEQKNNVSKLIKLLQDPDFDTYTFTVEAKKETNSFTDKQVVKFYDFSTLPDALLYAMPSHIEMIDNCIKETEEKIKDIDNELSQVSNSMEDLEA